MSTPKYPQDLPSVPTNPKITSSSMTPVSPLAGPTPEDSRVRGFSWAGFGTAILGVIYWAVKELGGLAALRDLPPIVIFCLALVFVAAAMAIYGKGLLEEMRAERLAMWSLMSGRDEKQTGALNEHNVLLERQGLLLDRLTTAQTQTRDEMRLFRKDLPRILAGEIDHEEEDKTPPDARPPRRSGSMETISADPDETVTAKRKRLAQR